MHISTIDKLSPLLEKPFFSTRESIALGVHPSNLAYYCKTGLIERVSRGVYRSSARESNIPFEWEDVALTAGSIPAGVICQVTALAYYKLTDEIPRQMRNTLKGADTNNDKAISKQEVQQAMRMRQRGK